MLRLRNILLILVIQYALLVMVSGYVEIHALSGKAQELQSIIRTAADMALEQSQIVDDIFTSGGSETYTISMPRSDGYGFMDIDMFAGLYGVSSLDENNREQIFHRLYNNDDFKSLASRLGAIRRPVRFWNYARNGLSWYYIPTVSMVGLDILPNDPNLRMIRDANGNPVPEAFAQELYSTYGLNTAKKISGGKEYYLTPISVGITYINPDLLGALFMNNLDLLMRQKYETNLNTPEGGNGVLKGSTYSHLVRGDLSLYNPINNGSFTILRGSKRMSDPQVVSYNGITPKIEYKVIDMYDPVNDDLLVRLFGANKGGYPTKAEYLKSLDQNVLNPATMQPYKSKPVVVAKVSFYVDVIVPYFSLVFREMRGTFGDGDMNFLDVKPDDTSVKGIEGVRRVVYTRYFAVTP